MGLKAVVTTRAPADTDIEDEIEEIELPPREMWGELDNSGVTHVAASITPSSTPAATPAPSTEVVKLEFSAGRSVTVGLDYPFVWEGREITEIVINRLTLAEVNAILTRPEGASFTTFDIYAQMTGLPASVLRALDDDDGRAVTEKAYSFLPRALRMDES